MSNLKIVILAGVSISLGPFAKIDEAGLAAGAFEPSSFGPVGQTVPARRNFSHRMERMAHL